MARGVSGELFSVFLCIGQRSRVNESCKLIKLRGGLELPNMLYFTWRHGYVMTKSGEKNLDTVVESMQWDML